MEIAVWWQLSTYDTIDFFGGKPFGFSLKNKSQRFGSALRGRPLLQVAPSFSNSSPDCFTNSPPQSALRIRVSIIAMIDRGLCPLDTYKPLKRLDLNFLTSHSGRFFTHAGVLAVFKPRRGRLKIPVAPTGKLKLHVFPLRRAKENKHFGRFF